MWWCFDVLCEKTWKSFVCEMVVAIEKSEEALYTQVV